MGVLKFRVWHITPNVENCGWINDPTAELLVTAMHDPKNFIVEQFTGLTDKKGKYIYEGDILDVKGDFNDYMVVSFGNGKYYAFTGFLREDLDKLTESRVIGNIHDNFELLDGKCNARFTD